MGINKSEVAPLKIKIPSALKGTYAPPWEPQFYIKSVHWKLFTHA